MHQIRQMLQYSEYLDINTDDIMTFLRLHYPVKSNAAYYNVRRKTSFKNSLAQNVTRSCDNASAQGSAEVDKLKNSGLLGDQIVDLIIEHGLTCSRILEIESTGLNIDKKWIQSLQRQRHGIVFVFPFVDIDNILKRTAARRQEVEKYKDAMSKYLDILNNIVTTCVDLSNTVNDINFIIVNNNVESRNLKLDVILNTFMVKQQSIQVFQGNVLKALANVAGHEDYKLYKDYCTKLIINMPDGWNALKPTIDQVTNYINSMKGGGRITLKQLRALARKYDIKGRSKMDKTKLLQQVSKYVHV